MTPSSPGAPGPSWWAWGPVAAWMALIFVLSGDPQSGEKTGLLLAMLTALWELVTRARPDPGTLEAVHLLLRKAGHMAEYAILYVLVLRARIRTGRGGGWRFPLGFCLAAAVGDELHQFFVPHRVGTPADVAVDMAGAALAALGSSRANRVLRAGDGSQA